MIDQERFELSTHRIKEIPSEIADSPTTAPQFLEYFTRTAEFLTEVLQVQNSDSLEENKKRNHALYEDILPEHYAESFANPEYATKMFGEEYGAILSALTFELRSTIPMAYMEDYDRLLIRLELFLEVYSAFVMAKQDPLNETGIPQAYQIRHKIYSYLSDYARDEQEIVIRDRLAGGTAESPEGMRRYAKFVMEGDLEDLSYLYQFGDYITSNEIEMAKFMNALPEETIEKMAMTYTEGFRRGFLITGKHIETKKYVDVVARLGFERMLRASVRYFEKMGLTPIFYRQVQTLFGQMAGSCGIYGSCPNKQYAYDHREDAALFLDGSLNTKRLEALKAGYEKYHDNTILYAGPAVIECFGEAPFAPARSEHRIKASAQVNKMLSNYRVEASLLYNEAVIGEERSFTIISFPLPEIGKGDAERFADIFRAVITINTLEYEKYRDMQAALIQVLDLADNVEVTGASGNETKLTVALHVLSDPSKETIFENCVADVNIPVGEVFTSPRLKGTTGVLAVSKCYLNGLGYENLKITFKDGVITDYICTNFPEEKECRAYMEENILYHHPTLPMGEFAIGTNTTAYYYGKKYGIDELYPVLIAEKTGPHFAFGDTCYSQEEDNHMYNPDGKEIVAKENDFTVLRHTNPGDAYFGCHTDITIPYEELESIIAVTAKGERIPIIQDGRFVVPGTEELNEPLERLKSEGIRKA